MKDKNILNKMEIERLKGFLTASEIPLNTILSRPVVFKPWVTTEKMVRQDDLRKTYVTVQDSGKKQLNKQQNESNRQPP